MNLTETQSKPLKSQEKFEIISNFSPSGDQPNAIKTLVQNLRDRENEQVLLGVTGSVSYTHLTLPTILLV